MSMECMENYVFHAIYGKVCFPWNLWKSIFSMNFVENVINVNKSRINFPHSLKNSTDFRRQKFFCRTPDELDLKLPFTITIDLPSSAFVFQIHKKLFKTEMF